MEEDSKEKTLGKRERAEKTVETAGKAVGIAGALVTVAEMVLNLLKPKN